MRVVPLVGNTWHPVSVYGYIRVIYAFFGRAECIRGDIYYLRAVEDCQWAPAAEVSDDEREVRRFRTSARETRGERRPVTPT